MRTFVDYWLLQREIARHDRCLFHIYWLLFHLIEAYFIFMPGQPCMRQPHRQSIIAAFVSPAEPHLAEQLINSQIIFLDIYLDMSLTDFLSRWHLFHLIGQDRMISHISEPRITFSHYWLYAITPFQPHSEITFTYAWYLAISLFHFHWATIASQPYAIYYLLILFTLFILHFSFHYHFIFIDTPLRHFHKRHITLIFTFIYITPHYFIYFANIISHYIYI